MFTDTRGVASADQMTLLLTDLEEWMRDNGYEVAETSRSGQLSWSRQGFVLAVTNDAISIGYRGADPDERILRTWSVLEIWTMEEPALHHELDVMREDLGISTR